MSWCYIKLNVHDWSSILSTSLCPQGHLLHVFQTQPFNYTRVWFIQHFDQESRVGFVMFGKFSVHAWGQCGGLNEEHLIVVHWGPHSCLHLLSSWNEFGPQWIDIRNCSNLHTSFCHVLKTHWSWKVLYSNQLNSNRPKLHLN